MSAKVNLTEGLSTGTPSFNDSGNIFLNRSASFQNESTTPISIISSIVLFIILVSLGCTMEIRKIKDHIVKPKGVAIALVAQFGIMPLTAFCLAKILQLESIEAVTVLICGCCPGGALSNVLALALKGDMNLSVLMTTCSTFAALGMMPLLLFIYCQGFRNLAKVVPFTTILTILALTVIPSSMGIAINHHRPKYSPYILKGGLCIAFISTVVIGVIAAMSIGKQLWVSFTPQVMSTCVLMPMIGYTLGYVLSTIVKLNHQCRRTISMETGCQSVHLCTTILLVGFSPEVIGVLYIFPVLYFVFELLEGLLLVLVFTCYQTFKPPAEEKAVYHTVDVNEVEVREQESEERLKDIKSN